MVRYVLFAYVFFIGSVGGLFCQSNSVEIKESDSIQVSLDIFQNENPMELTIEFDIKEFQKKKNKGEYLPATITNHLSDSLIVKKKIKLKARGQFRRSHCSLPPFWINFKKKDLSDSTLYSYQKLKLVSHCNYSKASSQYIFKEYLVYKIYNLLSDFSFRARLVRIKYIDTGRKNKEYSAWGFIIEPESMMTDRLNCMPVKIDHLSLRQTDTLHTDIVAFFQYMIGNADFSIAGRHNVKLIKEKDFRKLEPIPVPYDFDYSGFVNTYYAIPGENLGIESVTDRYFLGACRTNLQYNNALKVFYEKKNEIIDLITSFEYLDDNSRKEAIAYINSFYTSIDQTNFFDQSIRGTCR